MLIITLNLNGANMTKKDKKKTFSVSYEGKKLRTKLNRRLAKLKASYKKDKPVPVVRSKPKNSVRDAQPAVSVRIDPPDFLPGVSPLDIDLTPPNGFSRHYTDKVQKTVRIKRCIVKYLEDEQTKTGVTPVTVMAQIIENWYEQVRNG